MDRSAIPTCSSHRAGLAETGQGATYRAGLADLKILTSLYFLLYLLISYFFFLSLCPVFFLFGGSPLATFRPPSSLISPWKSLAGREGQNLAGLPAVQVQVGSSSKAPHLPGLSSFKCQLTGVRAPGS